MTDSTGVTIERPTMQQVDTVVDLWVDLARDQRDHSSHLEAESNRDRIRESISRQIALTEIHVARTGDAFVGFVMYSIEGSTFERSADRGVIQNLYVVPAYRDRGVGSRLLETAERELETAGADVLTLEVMAPNEDARRFYRRHGYDSHRLTLEKPTENDTS